MVSARPTLPPHLALTDSSASVFRVARILTAVEFPFMLVEVVWGVVTAWEEQWSAVPILHVSFIRRRSTASVGIDGCFCTGGDDNTSGLTARAEAGSSRGRPYALAVREEVGFLGSFSASWYRCVFLLRAVAICRELVRLVEDNESHSACSRPGSWRLHTQVNRRDTRCVPPCVLPNAAVDRFAGTRTNFA